MEEDTYEIIYDNGVPVLAFQICDDAEPLQKTETLKSTDTYEDAAGTLQYFKDETVKCTEKAKRKKAESREVEELSIGRKGDKLEFVIVQGASKSSSKKLYDSFGFCYTLRNVSVREGISVWRCRFKLKQHERKECGAKLRITMDDQVTMLQKHLHPPDKSVDFQQLKATRQEVTKPSPPQRLQSKSSTGSEEAKLKQAANKTLKTELKECDKVLDYFSEGRELANAEDIPLVQEREVADSFWDEEGQMEQQVSNTASDENQKVQFRVVDNGNLTGRRILYDSLGYSYSIKEKRGASITWSCQASSSSDGAVCQMRVVQDRSQFSCFGNHSHSPRRHTLLKISKMHVFSSDKCRNVEQSAQRKSPKKASHTQAAARKEVVTPKKVKRGDRKSLSSGNDDEEDVGLSVKKVKKENNNEESFQFNTGDISFTVSLESEDKLDQEIIQSHLNPLQSFPFSKMEETISKLKNMAVIAQCSSQQSNSHSVQFQVVESSPLIGASTLFDSMGHIYAASDAFAQSELRTMWLCSSSRDENCPAKVIQFMNNFTPNPDHTHPPNLVNFLHHLVQLEAVEILKSPENVRKPAINLVNDILERYAEFSLQLNVEYLVERVTEYKKKVAEEFTGSKMIRQAINKKKIPKDFLLDQIMTETKFHLTFASEIQLAYLAAATEWYVDEADLDLPPFTTLFSIHVFTQHDENPRQTPVFFALISEKREKEYCQLFSSIKSTLNSSHHVSSIVIDLNIPLRKSILKSFTGVEIKCCDVHWSEEIACKLKDMDLSQFAGDYTAMNYLYQIPLLNLLPRHDFESALSSIQNSIDDDSVQDLICYIRETFGETSFWAPKFWSSFKMPVRLSNHDLWRRDLNIDNSADVDVYAFIRSLYLISKSIGDNLRLMPKKKIKKYYLLRPTTILGKVFHLWKRYGKGEYNCHSLLEKLASIIHSF